MPIKTKVFEETTEDKNKRRFIIAVLFLIENASKSVYVYNIICKMERKFLFFRSVNVSYRLKTFNNLEKFEEIKNENLSSGRWSLLKEGIPKNIRKPIFRKMKNTKHYTFLKDAPESFS